MGTEVINLQNVQQQLSFLIEKVTKIESNIEEIHQDLHQVKPEYIEKLKEIKKGKTHHFSSKDDFKAFLENEI
ncbi:hypothetical protein HYT52_05180 [Candidatus Woesearchaeota archaeon]|nr:hypothetical protein [Candidatus Woesearchaeota archaeon]